MARVIQATFPGVWMNLGIDAHITCMPPAYYPGIGLRAQKPEWAIDIPRRVPGSVLEAHVPVLYAALYESVAAHAPLGLNVVMDVGHHDAYSRPRRMLPALEEPLNDKSLNTARRDGGTKIMGVLSRFCTGALILGLWPGHSWLGAAQIQAQRLPDARAHHELVYHEGERLVYLVGGSTRKGSQYDYFADVWTWHGEHWARGAPLPFPRSSHRVVYHAGRRSLVLFGGGFGQAVKAEGVIWERRQGEWRAVAGQIEAGRDETGLCYDRRRDRIVVFGGWDGAARYRGDTWEWSGDALVQVDSTGPSPRAGHAFLYDPVRDRCLLFGGRGAEGYLADTWEWNGARWVRLEVAGPQGRWFFGSATDDRNERIVIFGGSAPGGDLADTWAWDGQRWTRLDTEGPAARGMAKLAFTGRVVMLFGGRAGTAEGFVDLQDTWVLAGNSWERRH